MPFSEGKLAFDMTREQFSQLVELAGVLYNEAGACAKDKHWRAAARRVNRLCLPAPFASHRCRILGLARESDVIVEEVVARSVGVSYPAINPDAIGMIKVGLPSIARQRAIADYLDREAAHIDALIEKLGRELFVLQERRQALITAAVTGQLDISKDV